MYVYTVITCILPALDVSPHLVFTRIAVGIWRFNPPLNFTRIFEFNPQLKLMELKLRFDPALDYICKYISPPNLVYNVIVMNLCHLD